MKLSKEEFVAKMLADQKIRLDKKRDAVKHAHDEYLGYKREKYTRTHRKSRWSRATR